MAQHALTVFSVKELLEKNCYFSHRLPKKRGSHYWVSEQIWEMCSMWDHKKIMKTSHILSVSLCLPRNWNYFFFLYQSQSIQLNVKTVFFFSCLRTYLTGPSNFILQSQTMTWSELHNLDYLKVGVALKWFANRFEAEPRLHLMMTGRIHQLTTLSAEWMNVKIAPSWGSKRFKTKESAFPVIPQSVSGKM